MKEESENHLKEKLKEIFEKIDTKFIFEFSRDCYKKMNIMNEVLNENQK